MNICIGMSIATSCYYLIKIRPHMNNSLNKHVLINSTVVMQKSIDSPPFLLG